VRVSHDRFAMHAETSIAVDPRDPGNLLGISMVQTGMELSLATYASFDGGLTWQSNGALATGNDPTVDFNAGGAGFACAKSEAGVSVWRTDDGGRTFDDPVMAIAGNTDHPWMAVDRISDASTGIIHVVASAGSPYVTGLAYARSTDGGRSFEPVRTIFDLGDKVVGGPAAAVGPNGAFYAIYCVWPLPSQTRGKDGGGSEQVVNASGTPVAKSSRRPEIISPIQVVASADQGGTFGEPVDLGMGASEVELTDDSSSAAAPKIAADLRREILYATYVVRPTGADHTDLVVAVSADRGQTWSSATAVAPNSGQVSYFQPQVAVDEAGRVGITAFALQGGMVDLVLFVADPDSLEFAAPVRVTSAPFDPTIGTSDAGSKHGA
jgi:hypothetical protein